MSAEKVSAPGASHSAGFGAAGTGAAGCRDAQPCPPTHTPEPGRLPYLVLDRVRRVRLDPPPVVGGLVALRVLRHVEAKHNVPPAGGGAGQAQHGSACWVRRLQQPRAQLFSIPFAAPYTARITPKHISVQTAHPQHSPCTPQSNSQLPTHWNLLTTYSLPWRTASSATRLPASPSSWVSNAGSTTALLQGGRQAREQAGWLAPRGEGGRRSQQHVGWAGGHQRPIHIHRWAASTQPRPARCRTARAAWPSGGRSSPRPPPSRPASG